MLWQYAVSHFLADFLPASYLFIIAYIFPKVKRGTAFSRKIFSIFIDEKIYSVNRQIATNKKE